MNSLEGKLIAWDLDDTLAEHAQGFAELCNKLWGLKMTAEDFTEDWCTMWGVDLEEVNRRSRIIHASDASLYYPPIKGAYEVVSAVGERNTNLIVTSRREPLKAHTATWIANHFSGLFEGIYHSGIFDRETDQDHVLSKAELLQKLGADYLVDDQPKHCNAADELGIKAVLYGDYAWNRNVELREGVDRCHTMQELGEYFGVAR